MGYLISGLICAIIFGFYTYSAEYLKRAQTTYQILQKAKISSLSIKAKIKRMRKEINLLRSFFDFSLSPKNALFEKIGTYERLGLEVSIGNITENKKRVVLPLNISFKEKDIGAALSILKKLRTERFPLLLTDSFMVMPNRNRTALLIKIRGKLIYPIINELQ